MENFISKLKNLSIRLDKTEVDRQDASGSNRAYNRRSSRRTSSLSSRVEQLRDALKRLPLTRKFLNSPESGNPEHKRRPLYRRRSFWAVLAATSGAGLAWGYWSIERSLPDVSGVSTFVRDGTLTVKAADGSVLQKRGPATHDDLLTKQIPKRVVEAFIASEDRRFYQHHGIDYQGIVRAAAANLLAGKVVEGGSTITQQVARIVFLTQDRTIWRKLQEVFLAQKIERELHKEKILERYLNLVYLGSGAYGVGDAARVYFSKSVNQLTLSEIATIAGLPPAPSEYSPLVNPDAARERRNIVLARMQEAGFITEAEKAAALAAPIKLKQNVPRNFYSVAPYFTTYVQQQLPKLISREQLEAGGLTVETTLNPQWQKAADRVIANAVNNYGYYEGFSQAALVAIDPSTGAIRAMVGGANFKNSQFNRAVQAQRQPGSTFKGLLYTAAIATGMSPYDGYLDAPFSVDGYKPQNFGRKYSGWLSLREALTKSVNVISVKLLLDVGFDPAINLAKSMGIKSKLLPTYSLALGASEVNLLEITNAYATLASQGKFTEAHGIRRVINRKGEVLYDASLKSKQVVDKGTVAIVTWMLQNVVNSGTGQAARLDRPVAGKTGTSEQARDLWFIGYIPQLSVGVWLGNDDNYPTWGASSTAAETWHDFMVTATKGMPVKSFPDLPDDIDYRKGSMKAKPVQANVYQGSIPAESSSSEGGYSDDSSSGGSYSGGGSSSESYDSGSSGSSDGYQGDSGSSYDSAPAAEPPAESSEPAPPAESAEPAPP